MIALFLGRWLRRCIRRLEKDRPDFDYMTDAELSDFIHGRAHTIDWAEIARRRRNGDIQVPALKGRAA